VKADFAFAQLLQDVVDFGLQILLFDAIKREVGRNQPTLVGQAAS
jgi:hypothetical protein